MMSKSDCPDCSGTGYNFNDLKTLERIDCPRCGGTGVEYSEGTPEDVIAELARKIGIKSIKQTKVPNPTLIGSVPSEAEVWVQTAVAAVRSGRCSKTSVVMANRVAEAYEERFLND